MELKRKNVELVFVVAAVIVLVVFVGLVINNVDFGVYLAPGLDKGTGLDEDDDKCDPLPPVLETSPSKEPCDGAGDDEDTKVGDEMHVDKLTGEVTTVRPVITLVGENGDVVLRYSSLRAGEAGAYGDGSPLGYGWSHGFEPIRLRNTPRGEETYFELCGSGDLFGGFVPGGNYPMVCNAFFEDSDNGDMFRRRNSDDMKLELINGGANLLARYADGREYLYAPTGFLDLWNIVEMRDSRGRTTYLVYGREGGYGAEDKLQKIVTAHGREILFVYDNDLRVEKIIDPKGGETTLTYEGGDVSSITLADGSMYEYGYDNEHRMDFERVASGNVYRVVYEDGEVSSRTLYDGETNVIAKISTAHRFPDKPRDSIIPGIVSFIDGRGQQWENWRNEMGQITHSESPDGKIRTWVYGTDGFEKYKLLAYVNEKEGISRYEWGANGMLIKSTDPERNIFEYLYENNRFEQSSLLTGTIRPDGERDRYIHDSETSDVLEYTDFDGKKVTYEYEIWDEIEGLPDGWDEPLPERIKSVDIETRDENNLPHSIKMEYDVRGNVKIITRAEGELDLVTYIEEYDELGNSERISVDKGDGEEFIVEVVWDELGRLTDRTIDPSSDLYRGLDLETHIEYDEGLVKYVMNGDKVISYNYDHRNRVDEIVRPFSPVDAKILFSYDGEGNVKSMTNANGAVTFFDYNPQNYIEMMRDAEGYITQYERDPEGYVVRVDRGLEPGEGGPFTSVRYTYDSLGRVLTEAIDPDGDALTTRYEYDVPDGCGSCGGAVPGNSLPYKIVDVEGKVTYINYDKLNRVKKIVGKVGDTGDVIDGDDVVVEFSYDPLGNIIGMIGAEGEEVKYKYDEAYRIEQVIRDPNGERLVTAIVYDDADNVESVTFPNGNEVWYEYDNAGRLSRAYDGLGDISSYTYTSTSRIRTEKDGLGYTYAYDYDELDRPVSVTVPGGEVYGYGWDRVGRLIDITGPLGIVTHYDYDDIGRLLKEIRNYQGEGLTADTVTGYSYNGAGWLMEMVDDDRNPTNYDYDDAGRLEKITYSDGSELGFRLNGVGNVVWRKNPDNKETTFVYDDLHRIAGRVYDERSESFIYDKSGRLLSASNDISTNTFVYDSLDRLEIVNQAIAGNIFDSTYDYLVGEESIVTRNGPERGVTHALDLRGRVKEVNAGNDVGAIYTFDIDDRLDNILSGNGVLTELDFDMNDRLIGLSHALNTEEFFDEAYGYDDANRITYTENLLEDDMSSFAEQDPLDRLTEFERGTLNAEKTLIQTPLDDPQLSANMEWGLDSQGNWESFVEDGEQETRTHNGVNEILAVNGQNLEYDANGNIIMNPIAQQRYEYDEENRLIKVRSLSGEILFESAYDALGRRVETIDYVIENPICGSPQIVYYVYDGLTPAITEEYVDCDGELVLMRETISGSGFPNALAVVNHQDGNSEVVYLHNDYLGSPIALTDSGGNVVEKYAYNPYGEKFVTETNGNLLHENVIGFTGQRYDESVGLNHFMFRTFSPGLGVFLQRDPSGYADGVNLYEYVGSSPFGAVDSLGLDDSIPWYMRNSGPGELAAKSSMQNKIDLSPIAGEIAFNSVILSLKLSEAVKSINEGPERMPSPPEYFLNDLRSMIIGTYTNTQDAMANLIPGYGEDRTLSEHLKATGNAAIATADFAMMASGGKGKGPKGPCTKKCSSKSIPEPPNTNTPVTNLPGSKALKPEFEIIKPGNWDKLVKKHKVEVERAIRKLEAGSGKLKRLNTPIRGGNFEIRTSKGGRLIFKRNNGNIELVDFLPCHQKSGGGGRMRG